MKIIDFHTHFFPDKVAAAAVSKIVSASGSPAYTDGTCSRLLRSMEKAGMDRAVVLPVATNPVKVSSVNQFSHAVNEKRLVMLGALHPRAPQWSVHLEEVVCLGMPGIKLHPDYQGFHPDDPGLKPFFAALRESGLFLVIHAGEDLAFRPPFRGGPGRIARMMDTVPGLKVIATHLGGFRMWDEVEEHLVGKPVYLDTSFTVGFMEAGRLKKIISKHGAEYVLFGTDSPWLDQSEELKKIQALKLGSKTEELIFYRNALCLIPELETRQEPESGTRHFPGTGGRAAR